jgi:5'-nucleotidase
MNRRNFIQNIITASGAASLGALPLATFGLSNHGRRYAGLQSHNNSNTNSKDALKITILHTNDVHSHLDPMPKNDPRNAGRGGVINRAKLISKIRSEAENVLLFDAGDVFQGTPYFNFFKGKPEIELLSLMGYDAITIGNHDFDGGLELYAKQIREHATFPVLVANYDFTNTPMSGLSQPYKIFKINGLKIGVFGLGINPKGLIANVLVGETKYLEPFKVANETAKMLKNDKKCGFVVCLSHLGYEMRGDEPSDLKLAAQSSDIDLIIGGHTHTFLKEPTVVKNKANQSVLVNQVGFGGINLGRLDFTFDPVSKEVFYEGRNLDI